MQKLSRRRFLESAAMGVAAAAPGLVALYGQARHEWVSVKYGNRSVESVLSHPQAQGKAPALIVIHEAYGMTDWVESVTDEFAGAGFLAIAPDLLSGSAPNGGRSKDFAPMDAQAAVTRLPVVQINADLNAVADYCKSLPDCNGKVCVAGFAWGGGEALRFAMNRRDLASALVFYGHLAPNGFANIQAPVYGFYAEIDDRVLLSGVQSAMKAAGKSFEVEVYPGSRGGFMRTATLPNAEESDRKARAAAWVRLKALSAKYR